MTSPTRDSIADEFEKRVMALVNRDGHNTYIPSRELTLGRLHMSVGADSFGHHRIGIGIYVKVTAWDANGIVFKRHYVNGNLKEERLTHYMDGYLPMLRQALALEDLSDV